MSNIPPDYCPYCGDALSPVDAPTKHYCSSCNRPVFYNPIPTARLAIIDGEAILLVKAETEEKQDLWGTPGGVVEGAEDPDEAGARELEEETTLTADSEDFVLFDARTFVKFETVHKTYIAYAVRATDVCGTPEAADEVTAVEFWTPSEFATASDRLLTSWPTAYKNLRWWVRNARRALTQASVE